MTSLLRILACLAALLMSVGPAACACFDAAPADPAPAAHAHAHADHATPDPTIPLAPDDHAGCLHCATAKAPSAPLAAPPIPAGAKIALAPRQGVPAPAAPTIAASRFRLPWAAPPDPTPVRLKTRLRN